MKISKILIITGICVAFAGSSNAATKCVALSSSTTCTANSGTGANWSATCGGISVEGVAFCGSQSGSSIGTKSDNVTVSSTSDDNKYCWCKMVSPAVSSWVFRSADSSAGFCAFGCAAGCAVAAQGISAFRSALFSGLGD